MTTKPPAPTVTGHEDASPCPRAEVVVSPMPSDAAKVTVWRNYGGRREIVRGARNARVAGDFLVVDYEVPLGVPVFYTATTASSTGVASALSDASGAVFVTSATAWIQDALDPLSAMPVSLGTRQDGVPTLVNDSLASVVYGADVSTLTVVGRSAPIGLGTARRDASGVGLELLTDDDSTGDQLMALLDQAFPLCVRTPPEVRALPGLAYLALGDVSRRPLLGGGDLWSFAGDTVAPPGLSVVREPRTWSDVLNEASTWDALLTTYPKWIDLQRG